MNTANRTTEQLVALGAHAMHGAAFFVTKRRNGRSWVVTVNGQTVPCTFKTKRDAVAHAERAVTAFTRNGL